MPHGPLLEVLQKRLPDKRLLRFLKVMVANPRHRGLRQGNPLSPLLLNVYLDHFLDQPWRRRHPEIPLIRYVDDLLLLARTRHEAEAAYVALRDLLRPAGLELKGEVTGAVAALEQQTAAWLGFRLQKHADGLEIRLADEAWEELADGLAGLHRGLDAPLVASQALHGWLDQWGPTYRFEDRAAVLRRVEELAHANALDEIPSRKVLRATWKHGDHRFRRWRLAYRSGKPRGSSGPATGLVVPAG